jgi:lysophospholipase L1-like esterase
MSQPAPGARPEPLPLPVRVLVKGASTALWTSWMGGPRSDLAFPRAIEDELLALGRPAEVRNAAVLAQPTYAGTLRWEQDVVAWSPDVVVHVVGHYETIHLFLPHSFERHANKVIPRRPLSAAYRKLVLRPVWKLACEVQAAVDRRVGRLVARRRARRVAADLERYAAVVRQVASPLLVFMELLPPATTAATWFPGMPARIEAMNAEIEAMVERVDRPDVRFFRTSEIARKVAGDDLDVATPDGFHFTPELHRAVGEALAQQVDDWAATQSHLAFPRPPR